MKQRCVGAWVLGVVLVAGCGSRHEPSENREPDETGAAAGAAGEGGKTGSKPTAPDGTDSSDNPVLTGAALAAEIERIAGTSFEVVDAQRFAEVACLTNEVGAVEPRMAATFHFARTDAGELETIVSVHEPWLHVGRARLSPIAGGFRVLAPPAVGGCLADAFEEALALELSIPTELELSFRGRDHRGRPTELAVRGRFDGTAEWYEAAGAPDEARPRLEEAPRFFHDRQHEEYFDEVVMPWRLPRRFQFSEALRPGWTVAIENEQHDRFELAQGDAGDDSTFDVAAYFPPGFRWLVEGEDLVGNPVQAAGDFPSFGPALTQGELESALSVGLFCDGGYETYATTDCADDFGCAIETAAPLAGKQSLAVEGCQAYLRIARAPNATSLHLVARVAMGSFPRLELGVRSLDPGSVADFDVHVFEDWNLEESTAGSYLPRSLPVPLSVPLPPGTSDVLVSIAGHENEVVWVDSVRTE